MASSKEYLNYVLEQLSDLSFIRVRAMMGEYILYYKDKIVGGIYDDRLLIKPVESAINYITNVAYDIPYKDANKMILITELDDKKFLFDLFNAMYDDLDYPKRK